MRFTIIQLNLLILLCILPMRQTQSLDAVWFPPTNFSYCNTDDRFTISEVHRYFDVHNARYKFNFTSISSITVDNLNKQGSISSASMFELRFGFQSYIAPRQQFCPDLAAGSACPISPGQNFTIERSFNVSSIPLYPLADITAQYSAIDADSQHLICVQFAPVGYQHPIWQKIFTFLPVGLTAIAAILSIIASMTIFHHEGEHDIFLFSSNYAMLPGVLRLKTPGFFDLVFYAQFIVIAGQFNIDYPRFFALFTSNFSWSFLLIQSPWLQSSIQDMFSSSQSPIEAIASVPGSSLYKRQLPAGDNKKVVDVIGTGMLDFANASGIDMNALFFTFLVYALIILGSCAVLCILTWLVLFLLGTFTDYRKFLAQSRKVWNFSIGVFVRILSLLYLPMLVLSFYQLMIPSRWYITLLAAFFIVISLLFFGFVAIKLFQIRPASFIYTEFVLLLRYGSLYNTYTDDTFHFFIALVVYKSLVAAMIGLFQTSGLAQLILVILAEASLTLGLYLRRPYADSHVNFFQFIFGLIRTLILFLNITYLPQLQATYMAKQYVGYVQMAIHCFAYFIFLIFQIKNIVVIFTGLTDDELDESGRPPARMVIWRKKKRTPNTLMMMSNSGGGSSANLMTLASSSNNINHNRSRSHSASFYMGSANQTAQRLTMDSQTLTNYYGNGSNTTAGHIVAMKPDEIKRVSQPLPDIAVTSTSTPPEAAPAPRHIQSYVSQTYLRNNDDDDGIEEVGEALIKPVYRLDNDIVPSSVPLMTGIQQELNNNRPPPPPLPKHVEMLNNDSNISSIYSPPHQPSPTSIHIQEQI